MPSNRSKITHFVAAACAALLLLALAPGAAPAADDGTPEPRIVNGLRTSDFPTTGALLFGNSPTSATSWCSGTMIGCDTFLTAAHCVCDFTGPQCQNQNAPDPGNYFVFLQHSGTHSVESITVHPGFNFPVADVAIVKLSTPVNGISPTPINTTQDPAQGTPGTIAGFGRSGGNNFDYGLKRYGDIETAACPLGVSGTTSVCWQFAAPVGAPGTDSNTCNADSGGPLFIDFGEGDVVAGITSGGQSFSCEPLDRSYDANVWFFRDWISGTAGADLENTTCGDRSQVGDVDTLVEGFVGTVTAAEPEGRQTIQVADTTDALVVSMNAEDDGSQRFDLYLKQGSPPTLSNFDCRSSGNVQYGACEIENPTAGPWHLLVNRSGGTGDYQATATQFLAGGPTSVRIDLISSTASVPLGGIYRFTVDLSNDTGTEQTFLLSLRLVTPEDSVVPLIAGAALTFPAGGAVAPTVNLPVSNAIPTGSYTMVGLILDPTTFAILSQDTTQFEVF